jgi:3-methyladenine DNA glycosylase/8-oxoguanine DNA glycosylase
MPPATHAKAIRHLRAADPALDRVIDVVGPCRMAPHSEGEHFHALIRAIVYQQLSGKAAATIHTRVLALFGSELPHPDQMLSVPDESLRAAGLSRQKIAYLRDLAERVASQQLPLATIEELDDDSIERTLTSVNGVGRWTAQMFLIFRLGRPDVLPESDLGIRKGVKKAYRLRALPSPARVRKIGTRWSPWSSVASWYLWRLLEVKE